MPSSRTLSLARSPAPTAVTRIVVPGSLYLEALVSRLDITCDRRSASPSTTKPSNKTWRSSRCFFSSRSGRHHLQPSRDHDRELDAAFPQCNLAARDARHVEQVLDQPDEVTNLPLDDGDFAAMAAAHPGEVKGGQDRRKRIAQLVPEHRQELVLGADGGFSRLGRSFQLRPQLGGGERGGERAAGEAQEDSMTAVGRDARGALRR